MIKTANVSICEKHRYRLSREWKESGLLFAYFGVNPSKADSKRDDATVKKWIGFTDRNGGRGFVVGNVFSFRSTDVKELSVTNEPIGPENSKYVQNIINDADVLVPCWGNTSKVNKELRHHFEALKLTLFMSGKPIFIFGLTKSGDPIHPLMIGYSTPMTPWCF